MKLLLCADREVGFGITHFLVEEYLADLVLIVCVEENDIYRLAKNAGVRALVFNSNKDLVEHLQGVNIDLGLLAWWPKIIPESLLHVPRWGFMNTHPSLLPHNRGKHYNFWAIVEEAPFGVTLHFVATGVDTGDIVAQQSIPYDWCDNGGTLFYKAQEAMVALFRKTYPLLREQRIARQPQNLTEGSFHKASELDAASRIDLEASYRARDLLNRLRARTFPGYPGCWFEENGCRYEVRVEIRRVEHG